MPRGAHKTTMFPYKPEMTMGHGKPTSTVVNEREWEEAETGTFSLEGSLSMACGDFHVQFQEIVNVRCKELNLTKDPKFRECGEAQ